MNLPLRSESYCRTSRLRAPLGISILLLNLMGCEADQPSEIVKAWIEPSIPLCTALVNPPRVDEKNVDDIRSKLDGPRFLEKLSLAFVEVRDKRWELLEPDNDVLLSFGYEEIDFECLFKRENDNYLPHFITRNGQEVFSREWLSAEVQRVEAEVQAAAEQTRLNAEQEKLARETSLLEAALVEESDRAYQALWSVTLDESELLTPCDALGESRIRCESLEVESGAALPADYLPVMLAIGYKDKTAYTVLLETRNGKAILWNGMAICEVSQSSVEDLWTRSFKFLWQTPKWWRRPLARGDSGQDVAGLIELFARLDGLPAPPLTIFTEALEQRVRLFQSSAGLPPTGEVDEKTLVRLTMNIERDTRSADADRRARRIASDAMCLATRD